MTASSRRPFVAALALVTAALTTTSVQAMGGSGAPTVQPADRLGRMETEQKTVQAGLQTQVETLRKELEDLKARLALLQGVASAH